jgi:hypothetical protein
MDEVKNLPLYHIPSQCSHSDILKNIMINCSNLSFTCIASHVKAHQDDHASYKNLTRSAQLNCQMDYHAKKAIWDTGHDPNAPTQSFPLEPLGVFLGRNKLTSDKGEKLCFWVQAQLAQEQFYEADILYGLQFDSVDSEMVHGALHWIPRMFQIWVCKQIMDIAPTNGNRPWETELCPLCLSCGQVQGDLLTHSLM